MDTDQPRDLLAERIRRLEARIAELGDQVSSTRVEVERATRHLDALVDLVGRLGRVVDVQGSALHVDENQLERKVDSIDGRVAQLADGLADVTTRLRGIANELTTAPKA